jgi:hypothetical protein
MRSELNTDDLRCATTSCNNSAKRTLSILNTLIVIVGIYFEQCNTLDSIMNVN